MLRIDGPEESKTLEKRLFDVLTLLVERAPGTVSVDDFLATAWQGVIVEDNSVHRAISRLRKAFRDDPKNPTYIETIPKFGYRLACPVFWQETAAPDPSGASAGVYVQLRTFQGYGAPGCGDLALALTNEVQALLLASRQYAVMPRPDQVPDQVRKAKYVIAGSLQEINGQLRLALELSNLLLDKVEWGYSCEVERPGSFAAQSQLAERVAGEVLAALHQLG